MGFANKGSAGLSIADRIRETEGKQKEMPLYALDKRDMYVLPSDRPNLQYRPLGNDMYGHES